MQGIRLAFMLLLGGCTMYFGGGEGDDVQELDGGRVPVGADAEPPSTDAGMPSSATCVADVALALIDDMFATLPITLAPTTTTLCIKLDTRARTHPTYFDAQTPMEQSQPSSFGLRLFDAELALLADGYDAPLSTGQTYATVSYYVQTSGVFYVKLRAWAQETAQPTQLKLSLYQILD